MTNPAVATRHGLVAAGQSTLVTDQHGREATGAELAAAVDRVAGALDVTDGARVGIWMQNSVEAIEAFLAVEWVGATRVPVDPGAAPAEAARVFTAAGCSLVITDATRYGRLDGADLPTGCAVVVHDRDDPLAGAALLPREDVPGDRALHLYPRAVAGDELLAVPITYAAWDWMIDLNADLYRDGTYGPPPQRPVFLTVQQLMHGTSLLGTFSFLRRGWPQVIMERFDAALLVDLVARHDVTSTAVVTGMLPALVAACPSGPPASLRQLLYGGAPIPVEQLRAAIAAFPDALVQGYGRLEGGWPIAVLDQHDHAAIAAGDDELATSFGRALPQVEIDLRPLPSADLPSSAQQELRVRSPGISPSFADPDGWCGLGDLVTRDGRGYLHLVGRDDDMINTGYHVYPAEIESVLRRVPGIVEASVFGVPDPVRGQRVAARVTIGVDQDEQAVRDAIEREVGHSLARYKHPAELAVVVGP